MTKYQKIIDYSQGLKPSTKLSQNIQAEVEDVLNSLDDSELYQFLMNNLGELQAPVKQAISEWIRKSPDKIFTTERIELLKRFRDEAKNQEILRYIAVLGLIRYNEIDPSNISILNQWLEKSAHKKQLSDKIESIFNMLELSDAIDLILHIKECLVKIEEKSLDNIKRRLSSLIREISVSDNNLYKKIKALEELLKNEFWIKSALDRMMDQSIKKFLLTQKNRVDTESISAAKIPIKDSDNNKPPLISQPVEIIKELTLTQSHEEKDVSNDTEKMNHPPIPSQHSSVLSSMDALSSSQKNILDKIGKEFDRLNREIKEHEAKLQDLSDRNLNIEKDKQKLKENLASYKSSNKELEITIESLRKNIQQSEEEHRNIKLKYESVEKNLKSQLSSYKDKNASIEDDLQNLIKELEKQKQLSHSTLQDSKHRADVEVMSKLSAIRIRVTPVFDEVREFEDIADTLPHRAQMLLNILNKLKNALIANGVLT